jgi:hypothetical protein
MRYMKSVESATKVKSTDYQLKAARKYQSSFNSLYTISGAGANPVMIEMFNNDVSLIWALANIIISATSAGFKVVEHTNRSGRLVRVDIRPYMVNEPQNECHVFEKVESPQMTLIMLEVARIIKMNIVIQDGAEIPNIKYFQDDGVAVPCDEDNIVSVVNQVSSNDLLKDLLSKIDLVELMLPVHQRKSEVDEDNKEVDILPSPIRVDEYIQNTEKSTPVEKWMDENLSPEEKAKMCNKLNKTGSSIKKLSIFKTDDGLYIAPSKYVFTAFKSRQNGMRSIQLHDFDATARKLMSLIKDGNDMSVKFLDNKNVTSQDLIAEIERLRKTLFGAKAVIDSKLLGTIIYDTYKDRYGIVAKVYSDATGVASVVTLAFDYLEDHGIVNFYAHTRSSRCSSIQILV